MEHLHDDGRAAIARLQEVMAANEVTVKLHVENGSLQSHPIPELREAACWRRRTFAANRSPRAGLERE